MEIPDLPEDEKLASGSTPNVSGGAIGGRAPITTSRAGRILAGDLSYIAWILLALTVIGGIAMVYEFGFEGGRELNPMGLAVSLTATFYGILFGMLVLAVSAGLRLLSDIRDAVTPSGEKPT